MLTSGVVTYWRLYFFAMCPPTLSPLASSPIHLHCSNAKRECIYCINVNPVVGESVHKGWGRKLSWKIEYDFITENASPRRSKIWRLSFCKCVLPPPSFPVVTLPIPVCRNWSSSQVNINHFFSSWDLGISTPKNSETCDLLIQNLCAKLFSARSSWSNEQVLEKATIVSELWA